ncbi:hypothetical protein [Chromobacterium violaceum]|uniref:hypothetical protein n=1 Tax=Chromobacterium violaceum TaxID=536 RepID=UPI00111C185E|nr:hypothetical protein [Chromobacterium violaceum]
MADGGIAPIVKIASGGRMSRFPEWSFSLGLKQGPIMSISLHFLDEMMSLRLGWGQEKAWGRAVAYACHFLRMDAR